MSVAAPWGIDERQPLALGRLLQCVLATASVGAAVVHLEAARDHSLEPGEGALVIGALMAAAGQLVWAALIMRGAWQRRLGAGMLLNLVLIGGWALSRTTGLPLAGGGVEPLGFKDGVAVFLEAAIIAGAGLLALIPRPSRAVHVRAGRLAAGATMVSVAALAVIAVLFAPAHGTATGSRSAPQAASERP